MTKKIVICCDGTGNEVEADESNVLRLARMLEQSSAQVTYYDPGVGTQGAPTADFMTRQELLKVMGMGLGLGLYDRIASAYRFLMHSYEAGDEIHIFGFSRGAYVARALAGLIAKIGILEKSRDNLVPYSIKLYSAPGNSQIIGPFRDCFVTHRPQIRFLGLWDTVKSVFQFDPVRMSFTSVSLPLTFDNAGVDIVRHAIALDERRRFYRTNLWIGDSNFSESQDIKQVWFAGVHSDVGGSYPEIESGLSKISLAWMVREAAAAGLLLDKARLQKILPDQPSTSVAMADHRAPLHVSLKGFWKFFEWIPPFPRGKRRFVPDGALIHRSVEQRINDVPDYRPYLPNDHSFVD